MQGPDFLESILFGPLLYLITNMKVTLERKKAKEIVILSA
jgi:hypothetical protein